MLNFSHDYGTMLPSARLALRKIQFGEEKMDKRLKAAKISAWILAILGGGTLVCSCVMFALLVNEYGAAAEDQPMYFGWLMIGFVGLLVIICAVAAFISNGRETKLNADINAALPQMGNNAVRMTGYIAQKNEKGKAAAKSIASIFVGLISMLFIGFGVYSVYSGSGKKAEFVLSDEGLYVIDPKQRFSPDSVALIAAGKFDVGTAELRKNTIVYSDDLTEEIFKMTPYDKSKAFSVTQRLRVMISKSGDNRNKATANPFSF